MNDLFSDDSSNDSDSDNDTHDLPINDQIRRRQSCGSLKREEEPVGKMIIQSSASKLPPRHILSISLQYRIKLPDPIIPLKKLDKAKRRASISVSRIETQLTNDTKDDLNEYRHSLKPSHTRSTSLLINPIARQDLQNPLSYLSSSSKLNVCFFRFTHYSPKTTGSF
jgi:hypothetical protein